MVSAENLCEVDIMIQREPDWKKLYLTLFGKLDDALEALPLLPENLRTYQILHDAMQEAEDLYCKEDPS